MASDKEHFISAQCFVNGLIKKLNYDRNSIFFIKSARLSESLKKNDLALFDEDVTTNIRDAAVIDDALYTSQYGVLLPLSEAINGVSIILISLTVSYIYKTSDDIEFYVDNIKEPYTVHSSAIIKYIENPDTTINDFHNIFFNLNNTENTEGVELAESYYENYYNLLAQKIAENYIEPVPLRLEGKQVGRVLYFSDSR